jgi:zinc transport system substrate-binding protein
MLLPPASESHTYEPTPQDIISIQNADLFVYNGGESETWVDEVLKDIDTSKVKVISCMDMVTLYEEETVEGMQAEEEEEEGEEGEEVEYDEHVWTSPMNAKKIVEGIEKEVAEIDAANKDTYLENAASYEQKLDKLDSEFKDVVSKANNPTVVFGDRFPLRYFVEEYGIKYFAAFPGCAEDTEPNASTVAFLIDKVKAEKIPVVFHIELSNEKITNTICESTGAKSMLFHACHNISKDDFEAGVTYVDLMEQNVKNLDAALNE